MKRWRWRVWMAVGCLLPLHPANGLDAQSGRDDAIPRTRVGWSVGIGNYDADLSGLDLFAAVRVDHAIASAVLVEGGVGALVVRGSDDVVGPDFDRETDVVLFPQVQVQLQAPGTVSPYVGFGGGFYANAGTDVVEDDSGTTLSWSLGVRMALWEKFGMTVEFRDRWWGEGLDHRLKEYTVGISLPVGDRRRRRGSLHPSGGRSPQPL